MFKYFNPNPLGIHTGDCVVRAISTATDMPWEDVFIDLALFAYDRKMMPTENRLWMEFLRNKGLQREAIPNTCPDCYTINDFCADHPNGVFILATGSHVVAIIDGNILDTWDCGEKNPIYFWRVNKNG